VPTPTLPATSGKPPPSPSPGRGGSGRIRLRRILPSGGFGLRLFLALALALAVVLAGAYSLISQRIQSYQLETYASTQRADARSLEAIAHTYQDHRTEFRNIKQLLDAIGRRPGTREALLVGPDHVVRGSGIGNLYGMVNTDSHVQATLGFGTSFAGREGDPALDPNDFEFVTPVNLPDGRYALESSYAHSSYDAQLAGVRDNLLWVGLLAVLAISALFYLLGGRSLLRTHRIALERATRDGLTDLPNHRAFEDDFEQAAASAARHQESFALALIDLDHFKTVNDRHGHPQGDALLRRVAEILRDGRSADRAYRLGGDEFAVLLPHTDVPGTRTLAQRISRTLTAAGVAASVGVSTTRDGQQPDELRAEADAALYEAKSRGGQQAVNFEEIRERVAVTTSIKRESVRLLIGEGGFTTAFQPIWDLGTGGLLGIEALMRPDPSHDLLGPTEAFEVAEQTGEVHALDELCVNRAFRVAPELPEGALLFVNLSPKTLELDAGVSDWLLQSAHEAGLAPERIVVEVTERIGAQILPVIKSLQRMRAQGFRLALDDVGTGNAGLEMLRKVDAEYVKLDRSIVSAAATEPNARAVLMAMATFARQTGAFVIAEGIEDEETLEFLRGIEEVEYERGTVIQGGQGFRLGRPSAEMPRALSREADDAGRRPAVV
jgi:diguanylate cyclase (GGDEF)-like protein